MRKEFPNDARSYAGFDYNCGILLKIGKLQTMSAKRFLCENALRMVKSCRPEVGSFFVQARSLEILNTK